MPKLPCCLSRPFTLECRGWRGSVMVRGLSFRGCPAAQVSFRPRPDVLPLHKEGPGRGEAQCGLMRQQALPERPWGCRWLLLTQDDGLFQLGVGVRSATSGLVLPVCVPAGRWASSVLPPLHPPAEERSPVSHSQGPVRFLSTPRCSTYAHVVRALLQGLGLHFPSRAAGGVPEGPARGRRAWRPARLSSHAPFQSGP